VATFGQRKERELYPSHWFLLAALFWFPWIYSSANMFLVTTWPVRGVTQAVINWWYADNLIFVWLALVGIGLAFYFLPKMAGRPLHSRFYALFVFWTLMIFGSWIGVPQGAPVPAWLPTASVLASFLLLFPLVVICYILLKTLWGANVSGENGTYCYIKFGILMFLLSSLLLITQACPQHGRMLEFTWYGQAQIQLQILGFAAMILFGGIYDILPRVMGVELPYKSFVKGQFFLSVFGVALVVIPLAIAGVKQGNSGYAPEAAKFGLMISTTGLIFLLLGGLMLLLNIFVMTIKWKLAIAKTVIQTVTAPLETSEVKS
jgi:cytochrome c oxidase cbb3-type subunit 1